MRLVALALLGLLFASPSWAATRVFEKGDALYRPLRTIDPVLKFGHAALYVNSGAAYRFLRQDAVAQALPTLTSSDLRHSIIQAPGYKHPDGSAAAVEVESFEGGSGREFLNTATGEPFWGAFTKSLTATQRRQIIFVAGEQIGAKYTLFAGWRGNVIIPGRDPKFRCDGLVHFAHADSRVNAAIPLNLGGLFFANAPSSQRDKLIRRSQATAPACRPTSVTPSGGNFVLTMMSAKDDLAGSGIDRVEFYDGLPASVPTLPGQLGTDDHDSNPDGGMPETEGPSTYSINTFADPGSNLYTAIYDQSGNYSVCDANGNVRRTSDLVQFAANIVEDVTPPTLNNLDVTQESGGQTAKATWTPSDNQTPAASLNYFYAVDVPFEQWDDPDVSFLGQRSTPEYILDITGLSEGEHTFYLVALDQHGNIGATSKTILVDKTKPVVELWAENRTILLKDRAFNVYRTVTVSVNNSDGAGGGELEVFRVDPIDGRLVSQGKVPLDHSKRDYGSTDLGVLGNLPMGDIVIRATDAAGNSVDHHYTVTQDPVPLDTTNPLISAFSQVPERTVQASWQGDAPFNRLWLNNQVRSKDTLRGLAFGFDDSLGSGLSYVEIRGPEVNISRAFIGDDHADIDVTLLPDAPRLDPGGGPAYTVTAYDRQGNRSSARFNLDSIPPNFSDLKLKVGPDLTVSAKVSAFDNGSGVYEIGPARASPPAGTIGSLALAGEFVISQPLPDRPTLVIEEPGTIALTDAAGLANDLNPYAFMRKREIFTAGAGQTEQPVASGEFTRIRGVKCVSGCPVQVEIRSAGIPLPPPPPIEGNVPMDFEASISTQVFSLTATDAGVPVDITVAGDFTVKRGGETDGVIEIDADTLYGNGWKEPPAFHASPGLNVTLNSPYLNLTLAQVPPSNEETRVAITPATVSPPPGYLFPPGSPEFALNVTISGPYQGQLTLEMPYEPGSLTSAQQQALQLFRFHDGGWTIITTGVDTQGRTVTGQTLTNSLFAIFIATSDAAGPPDDTPPMSAVAFQAQTRYTSPGGDLYLSAPGGATLSATDAGAGVDKILFGADLASSTIALGLGPATESFYQAYGGPLSIPEGAHVLAYGARDLAGNYEVLRTTRVYVDGTPPSVSLSSSAGQYSLSAMDPVIAGAASGVNLLFYLVDGDPSQCQAEPDPRQPPGTCANPVYGGPFSLAPGTHTLTIGANDHVDNSTRATVLLDVVAPDLLAPWTFLVYASTSLQGGAISVPEGALLALEAGDEGGSGVARTLLLVDLSPESCTEPLDPAAPAGTCANPAYAGPFSLPVGAHVVYFASVDGAGNREAQRSVSVTVLPPPAQGVSVDFDPDTLNLDSQGRFVTARIEAAGGSSSADIHPESVALTRVNDAALVPPLKAEAKPTPSLSDADGDGLVELALKFDRQALSAHLPVGDETRLLLEGRFKDGTSFSAAGAIRVIRPTRAAAGGAVAAHPSSPARVAVPAGALAGAVDLTVVRVAAVEERREERMRQAAELRRLEPLGRPFDFGPEGTRFAVPVTLTLPFDPAAAPVPEGLKIAYWNPTLSAWEPLDSVVNAPARTVSAKTTHFSQYQVVAPAAAAQAAPPPAAAPVQAFGFVDAYAYPNPARSGQTPVIVARFGSADSVEVALFDVSGRRVHAAALSGPVLRDDGDGKGAQAAFEYRWDVSGVGSGVYYFVLTARRQGFGPIRKTGRLAVIR